MDPTQITWIVIGALFLVAIVLCIIFRKNLSSYLNLAVPILQALLSVLKSIEAIVPNKNLMSIMTLVISTAIKAAGYAEKLWKDGEIEKQARPQHAQEYIINILNEAGIEVTPSIESIIAGAIAATCYLMPHEET